MQPPLHNSFATSLTASKEKAAIKEIAKENAMQAVQDLETGNRSTSTSISTNMSDDKEEEDDIMEKKEGKVAAGMVAAGMVEKEVEKEVMMEKEGMRQEYRRQTFSMAMSLVLL